MTNYRSMLKQKWALPTLAAAGLLLTITIVKLQPNMAHQPKDKTAIAANTIKLTKQLVRPEITGFGTVKPDLTLQAKAEASGTVTYVHPELKKGSLLPKDTIVMRIDDKDYQLALKQAQADLLANQASLKEMELNIENNVLELELANEKLKVREKELQRLQSLQASGTVSQSSVNNEKQALLAQKQEVQKLQNLKTTLPSELEIVKAKIDIAQAKVEQSERDLARTEITLPFYARISAVYSEKDQFISKGTAIFDAVGLQKVTINAQFPMDQFGQFIGQYEGSALDFASQPGISTVQKILEDLELTAKVELAGSHYKSWQAKVERFSDNLDPQSNTLGVIVSVTDSYMQAEPGKKPPLLEGMYMKVSLFGKASDYLVMPRFAVRQQQLYVLADDSTLQRVNVDKALLQGELALIKPNQYPIVNQGDLVVVSDLFPAVNGMAIAPTHSEEITSQINQWLEASQ